MPQDGSSRLTVEVMTSSPRSLASNAVLVTGEDEAVLIDTALTLADNDPIVERLRASGKQLKAVLVSHAHPDHYFGIDVVRDAFPEASVCARRSVIEQISEYRAKVIHWQELYAGEIPTTLRLPDPLDGDSVRLEGSVIELIDLFMIESLHATAFYLPSEKTLVAGDFVYARAHHYMSDVGDPDAWISELERVRDGFEIERVIPGHGPSGGAELLDESIAYLRDWKDVARVDVRFTDIAKQMMERYPDYDLGLLLWLTRGPGFGLAGAGEIGVPPELLGG
jgi:glyoxylase-like metal-dependent hydrolase (beta-lactamase superfamily II)